MINFEKNIKANEAMTKMWNLAKALAECGIESEVSVDHDNNIVALNATLWNCVDGSDVEFCVYSAEFGDWGISSYAEPENDRKAICEELDKLVE